MKRIAISAGLAAAAATLSISSASPARDQVDAIVYAASSAQAGLTYTGVVQSIVFGGEDGEAAVYRVEHRPPGLTERTYLSPLRLKGDVVLVRGTEGYFVDTKRRRVVETENDATRDPIGRDDNYTLIKQNYRADSHADETFDGRHVKVVGLVNRYTGSTTMVMRVDDSTKLVLDRQEYAPDGTLLSETRFQEVRYVATLPNSDFQVPSKYTVVHGPTFGVSTKDVSSVVRDAGFAARVPKTLAEGFCAVEGHNATVHSTATVHVLYSDGVRTVSIFENNAGAATSREGESSTRVGNNDGQYLERGRNTLLTWNDGTLRYTLVGDLSLDELKKLAASLTP